MAMLLRLDPRPRRVNICLFGCYVWSHGQDELTTFSSDGYALPAAPLPSAVGGWRAKLEAGSYGLDPRPGRVNNFLFGCYVLDPRPGRVNNFLFGCYV